MPAATAAIATTAAPAPQNQGVFAAARITAEGSLPAALGEQPEQRHAEQAEPAGPLRSIGRLVHHHRLACIRF
jgi:hypothetical protein